MIAAFDLNSTWTPLIGGLLVCRFGTARSSIVATFVIFLGQVVLLIGDFLESVVWMSAGLFIFGLGISPLSVVQVSRAFSIAYQFLTQYFRKLLWFDSLHLMAWASVLQSV